MIDLSKNEIESISGGFVKYKFDCEIEYTPSSDIRLKLARKEPGAKDLERAEFIDFLVKNCGIIVMLNPRERTYNSIVD